ncbi:NAD(P)H-quinone oxidoreductase subunit M [Microcystis aeruginosa]|uniref:NAD(P)H-quinone oxidoreductase subunit M n=1 Tax=Microcystis aeruginosa SPC777 TaxID=482300 RepID=S3J797_MICAE|nr:NAD(P)H-quinone oxidoreductase subunit M [Microcystis aeruginosa]EPF21663.1 NAD(P)H-quinone oxidoreductase subunit M [Microcystis aeruginosa SPC777]EPF24792.1 NAD(P)H-quinone oxidoreductase subunit M [Microcystis aeruginosa SPC777]
MLLKSTTRHIRIYTAEVKNNQLIESNNVLTLDVDPDNEFNWEEVALNKVYSKFDELVESYNGEELSEYNLRRIGSDLEHFIRSLLQKGEISYNLNARVQNYSMGQFKSELHHCLIYLYRIPHSGYDSQDIFEDDC